MTDTGQIEEPRTVEAFNTIMGDRDLPMIVVTTSDGRERSGCLAGFHAQASIDPCRYMVWISKKNHTYKVARGADVLAVHPHLEDIPDSVANWKAKPRGAEKLAAVLARERVDAMLYRELASLREDVPLAESLDDLAWRGVGETWATWNTKVGSKLTAPAR